MSRETSVIFIPLDKLQKNAWNPNVMPPAEYEALRKDMKKVGPFGVGPLLVSPARVFYGKPLSDLGQYCVIIDGEHRWLIAKELGWKDIRCEPQDITEEDAKAECYHRNREHGNLDPFKEANLFKTDLDTKMTQQEIADKYLIDASTVSHRLSLLKLTPEVTKVVEELPRGKLTVSHIEPLTTLQPPDQKLMLKEITQREKSWGGMPSVRDIENSVERLKQRRAMERKLEDALARAKYTKCPKCHKKPADIHSKGLPWVECESMNYDHTWNINTGKLMWTTSTRGTARDTTARIEPQTLRSNRTVKEIHTVFAERIKELYPKIDIDDVQITGKLNGQAFSFDLNKYAHGMSVSVQQAGKWKSFRAEEHEYRSGEKTTVHCGNSREIEKVKAFIEQVFAGQLLQDKPKKKE
jgi:ParB-like chromosome segregation protein Spo0J